MGDTGELRALLLTTEETTIRSFSAACNELGIAAEPIPPMKEVALHVDEQKYAAVVVDFEDPAAEECLAAFQQSRVSKNAVVLAVVTNAKTLERALKYRAHFVRSVPLRCSKCNEHCTRLTTSCLHIRGGSSGARSFRLCGCAWCAPVQPLSARP